MQSGGLGTRARRAVSARLRARRRDVHPRRPTGPARPGPRGSERVRADGGCLRPAIGGCTVGSSGTAASGPELPDGVRAAAWHQRQPWLASGRARRRRRARAGSAAGERSGAPGAAVVQSGRDRADHDPRPGAGRLRLPTLRAVEDHSERRGQARRPAASAGRAPVGVHVFVLRP